MGGSNSDPEARQALRAANPVSHFTGNPGPSPQAALASAQQQEPLIQPGRDQGQDGREEQQGQRQKQPQGWEEGQSRATPKAMDKNGGPKEEPSAVQMPEATPVDPPLTSSGVGKDKVRDALDDPA